MIDPPANLSGTAGRPITVRAVNDGKVLIDGEGARSPVRLDYNDYFILEGLNASRSGGTVVLISHSKHAIVRRVAAWDAADNNTNIFGTHSSEHVLFEDVAGWGIARKIFSASQGGNHFTCRRCWGSWDGSHFIGPKMTYTLAYNNYNVIVENSIGTWSGRDMKESYYLECSGHTSAQCNRLHTNYVVDQPYGIFAVDRLDGDKNANSRLLGSIAYITSADRFNPAQLFYILGIDAMAVANGVAYIQPGSHTTKRPFGLYGRKGAVASSLSARSLTGIGAAESLISVDWDTEDISLGTTTSRVGNVFSQAQGAEICTRYKDGVLTTEPLWPWPMNQRVMDAMAQSGRTPVDVTATIERMLGPIPSRCRR
jgi:hypothetical protein